MSNNASIEANAQDNHHRTISPAKNQRARDFMILEQSTQISSSETFKRIAFCIITHNTVNGIIHKNNNCVVFASSIKL
jgi:hypothetical protein